MSDEAGELQLRRQAKSAMRRRYRALRAAMPPVAIERRSRSACERLVALSQVRAGRRIALFWAIERHHEIDLRLADRLLREQGKALAYPAIDPESRRMTFRLIDDTTELAPRGMGFSEPPPTAPEAHQLDVIVVPGLAFDALGHRLGYGAGYYDRALPNHCPPAISIGVAFDSQLAVDLPHGDHDVPVHLVVTDQRMLAIGDGL